MKSRDHTPEGDPAADRQRLIELCHALDGDHETSMSVWADYWHARHLLRRLALRAYDSVTAAYVAQGTELSFPTEGFKDIAQDTNPNMDLFDPENQERPHP